MDSDLIWVPFFREIFLSSLALGCSCGRACITLEFREQWSVFWVGFLEHASRNSYQEFTNNLVSIFAPLRSPVVPPGLAWAGRVATGSARPSGRVLAVLGLPGLIPSATLSHPFYFGLILSASLSHPIAVSFLKNMESKDMLGTPMFS